MKHTIRFIAGASLFCILAQFSCGQQPRKTTSPPGYDLSKPEKFNMPEDLLEISGIAFNNGNPGLVYAEQDEDGSVFSFKLGDKTAHATRFGKSGDYEDISVLSGRIYMLRSDGSIFSFPLAELSKTEAANVVEFKKILPKAEYEGLYGDEKTGKLYALVKQENKGKQNKTAAGYVLETGSNNLQVSGNFSIDVKAIAAMAGIKKIDFKPSALARHPGTGQWFVVSSVNNALVVCDANWQVKGVYPLNQVFLQPEGIAFDRDGNLYISNEGDQISPGNILKFKLTKK